MQDFDLEPLTSTLTDATGHPRPAVMSYLLMMNRMLASMLEMWSPSQTQLSICTLTASNSLQLGKSCSKTVEYAQGVKS